MALRGRFGFESVIALKAHRLTTEYNIPDIEYLFSLIPISIVATSNYTPPVGNYLISVDSTSTNVIITLPSASTALAKQYTITKIDSSINYARITSSSPLADETYHDLLFPNESLTFFSNGTNWEVR